MNRRNFIHVSGLGAGTVLLGSQLSSCETSGPKLYGWSKPENAIADIRLKLLSYAILAPNPHNKQPWKVSLVSGNTIELFVDETRLLPFTDPVHRQIHVGQGTFIEMYKIAATAFGYEARVNYFPEGEYDNLSLKNLPIARIELIENTAIQQDPLFDQVLARHSNKRAYNNQPITELESSKLTALSQNGHAMLRIDSSIKNRELIRRAIGDAMAIECGNRNRDLETIAMFRFNDEEIEHFRDGFGVAQSGVTGVRKFMAESFFLNRKSAENDPTQFSRQAIDLTREQAETTQTFAWLRTATNTRLDQVKCGQDYCRLNLQTTAMGLAQHPMSQLLEEYDDMLPLQRQFKSALGIDESETVQMMFRIGRADPCPHSPRRRLHSLIQVV